MNREPDIEFGSIPIGTRFTIDSNGVTFEKTSDREAKIVAGDIRLLGVPSQFGPLKPVCVNYSQKPDIQAGCFCGSSL